MDNSKNFINRRIIKIINRAHRGLHITRAISEPAFNITGPKILDKTGKKFADFEPEEESRVTIQKPDQVAAVRFQLQLFWNRNGRVPKTRI